MAVLSRLGHPTSIIRTVYVTCLNPFPHVDEFVQVCSKRYRLDTVSIPGPMREALQQFLDCSHPKPKAIFVGIRRNDPYAGKVNEIRFFFGCCIAGLRVCVYVYEMIG